MMGEVYDNDKLLKAWDWRMVFSACGWFDLGCIGRMGPEDSGKYSLVVWID